MKYYPPRYLFRRHELLRVVRPGKKFLEIGPGNLQLARELLHYFHQGTLIDFSENSRVIHRQLPPPTRQRLELHVADFTETELPDDFDCVVACEVLEHVEAESAFLKRAHNCLRPGGQLVLSMPARMKLWSRHDEVVGHVRRYEREPVRELLHTHHFSNVCVIAYGFPFVNLLSWPRILLAHRTWRTLGSKTAKERTAWSGVKQTAEIPRWFGLVCNPYTVYPLACFATLFNNVDWSDGYLITADRE